MSLQSPIYEMGERGFQVDPEEDNFWVTDQNTGDRLFVRLICPGSWDGNEIPVLVLVPGGSGDNTDFLVTV
jgi:hypothetical protein